jgi:hypothetical protein
VIAYMLLLPEMRDKFERKEIPVFTFRSVIPRDDTLRELAKLAK